jgi:coenzyme F420-reducing hydrogenase beta subunit
MQSDGEGFLRPVIDGNKCIDCKKCLSVCPINNDYCDDGVEPKAYAAKIKDETIRLNSSSGGAFSAFAAEVLSRGGVVIAAGFDDDFNVVHKVCSEVDCLDELRRSKYVQSEIGTVYIEAEQLLKAGKEVLFCGTPCQVAGFRSYLGKDYPSLCLLDFICHGVPSPLAWKKYLDYQKLITGADIKSVSFRDKKTGWKNYSLSLGFENNLEYGKTVSEDYYLRSFIMDLDLRKSCYQCRFRNIHRVSDITLADFWGVDNLGIDWADDKGVSFVLIHSEKGGKLFEACESRFQTARVEFNDAVKSNPAMLRSTPQPALRDSFLKDAQKLPFNKLHQKYCSSGISSKIRRKASQLLSRR